MLKRTIKLLIADDHSVYRTGLKTFLSQIPHLEIAGEAGNGQDLMKLAIDLNPDVIITDLDMPVMSGIQATKELCKRIPYCRVIALTVHAREESILRMLEAGALGYVLKSADTKEIVEAIESVDLYKPFFCKAISEMLTTIITRDFKVPVAETVYLTEREKQIVQLICHEHTSKGIAHILCLSKRTIEGHRRRIMDKVGAKSIAGVIAFAYETGIYKKPVP